MKRVFRILFFLIAFGAMAAAVVFLPLLPFFCVYATIGKILLLSFEPIAFIEDEFVISYTHSVNKGRVHDFYRIDSDKTIELHTTRFLSYGAGMRELESDDGVVFVTTDDYMELQNLRLKMRYLLLAVGVIADHCIEYNGRNIRLTDFFIPQTRVEIGIKNLSVFDFLLANRIGSP